MLLLSFICSIAVLSRFVATEKVFLCYYGTWATYRWGNGKFDVENVNTELCTHLIYTFVGIDTQGNVISLDPYLDLPDGRDNFAKFNALKQKNSNLKTLLAVGGWNEGSGKYSTMAANPNLRQNFINSALAMVLNYGFDGFDLDWEYPARRDTVNGAADVENFSTLVKELREAFDKHGLLLTAAVSSVESSASQSYNIAEISKYLDLIGIMTYDMYGAWDSVTGHNAPLHRGEGDENASKESLNTVDIAIEYWLREGCPPEKLVVGLPLYGRSFRLSDANNNGVRAPNTGAGIAGPFTATSGSLGYNEFCDILQSQSNWEVRYDSLAKVPYAVQGVNWVSYDDPDSLTKKVEFGLQYNVAGFMVWSIETDDFHGICSGEDFPLLRAIKRAIEGNYGATSPTTTTSSSTTTTTSTTTASPTTIEDNTVSTGPDPSTELSSTTEDDISSTTESPTSPTSRICKAEGFASSPDDCSIFYMCVRDTDGELLPKKFECPETLVWDAVNLLCNYPEYVNCHV